MKSTHIMLPFIDVLALAILLKKQEAELDVRQSRILERCKKILFQHCTVKEYESLELFYAKILQHEKEQES